MKASPRRTPNRVPPSSTGRSLTGAAYTVLATPLPLVARVVLLFCLSAQLGPSSQGVFSHAATLTIVFVVILGTGVGMSASFLVARNQRRYLAACHTLTLTYSALMSAVAAFVLTGLRRIFPDYFAEYPAALCFLFPVLTFLSLVYLFQNQILAGLHRFKAYFWMNAMHSAALLLGSLTLCLTGRWSVPAAFIIWSLSLAAPLPWQARIILCRGDYARPPRKRLGTVLRVLAGHGLRSSVATISDCLVFRSGVLLLRVFAPFSVVGTYAIAASISEVILHLPKGLGVFLLPRLAATRAGVTRETLLQYRLVFVVLLISALGVALFVPLVPRLLNQPEYVASVECARILLIGTTLMGWGMLVLSHMRAAGDMPSVVRGSLLALAVALAANLALVPTFQAQGASLAATLAFASYACYAARWLNNAAKEHTARHYVGRTVLLPE